MDNLIEGPGGIDGHFLFAGDTITTQSHRAHSGNPLLFLHKAGVFSLCSSGPIYFTTDSRHLYRHSQGKSCSIYIE